MIMTLNRSFGALLHQDVMDAIPQMKWEEYRSEVNFPNDEFIFLTDDNLIERRIIYDDDEHDEDYEELLEEATGYLSTLVFDQDD